MNDIAVLGAGAFGTALAISLARDGRDVTLWARNGADLMQNAHENASRLPGISLPEGVHVTGDLNTATMAGTILLAVPTQTLGTFLTDHAGLLSGKTLVACCKGINLSTGHGPAATIADHIRSAVPALLSGPSFAVDIANGLPTALTLACKADATGLQTQLSTPTLRLYRSTDVIGVEIGGALKNVIAIACGIAIGAGLGESARAALMTRGSAEILRFALNRGARADTLAGLSGFGDLALTCSSEKSRNYAYGLQLGAEGKANTHATTEGIATAQAVASLAQAEGLDMPITTEMAAVLDGTTSVKSAITALMARPLRPE